MRAVELCDSRNKSTSRELYCNLYPPETTKISSCHMQTEGLPPMDSERPRTAQDTGLVDELGESRCACRGRRVGEAGSEVSEYQDSSVICARWAAHQWDRIYLHFSFSDFFFCLFVFYC